MDSVATVVGYTVLAAWAFVAIALLVSTVRLHLRERRERREWTAKDDRRLELHVRRDEQR